MRRLSHRGRRLTKRRLPAAPPLCCTYRFVAVPKTLQWWIRAPEHVDWVHVDLRRLFRASTPRLTVLTPPTSR